jgi:hypothetical protein
MKFQGGNGNFYVCVLTADHVVSSPALTKMDAATSIGFGNSTAPNASAPTTFNIVDRVVGGSTKMEDLGLALVNLGHNPNADLVPKIPNEILTWNTITPLGYVSLLNGTPGHFELMNPSQPFTTVGFGNSAGTFIPAAGNGLPAYVEAVGSTGTKRFQNNVASDLQNDFKGFVPYVSTTVEWHPGFGAGQGFVFRGDSGSPLLTSEPIMYTVNTPGGPVTFNNVNTDDIFGVVSFGPVGTVTAMSTEDDVALTPADVNWITDKCENFQESVIPEPSSLVLAAIGLGVTLLVARRRRQGRATGG